MEIGPAEEIIKNGIHPYTRALTKIMPVPGVNKDKERIVLEGETPDASIEMTGCRFCGRCPVAMAECSEKEPEFKMAGPEHLVACHRFSEA
jgi:oligopeptide/dipeptide ABC transporter, ATP-binding protein, C-terminal domain